MTPESQHQAASAGDLRKAIKILREGTE
jgi:hypothetical protein